MRVRLFYEKRGFACFVPHVALSTLFARAARRAGIEFCKTEGFSPRARISFGPELPAGVVALNEPVELWLNRRDSQGPKPGPQTLDPITSQADANVGVLEALPPVKEAMFLEVFNAQLPEGFRVTRCFVPAEGAPALGKECRAAHYLVWTRNGPPAEELLPHMRRHYGEAVLSGAPEAGKLSAVLADPAQNGIGGWVKFLTAEGIVSGWQDMCVVRTGLGRWNGERMEPMQDAKYS